MPLSAPAADGVIHDLGYQRYTGPRLGRGYAVRTLYLHTLRTAFGLGRGVKAKLFSWSIIGLIGAAGLVVTVVQTQTGEVLLSHPEFADQMSVLSIMFLAVVVPELVSRDQHTRALALYFARPLRRADYALARLGGLVTALWLVLVGPQLLMFTGAALTTTDGAGGVADAAGHLAAGIAHAALHAIVLGTISVLVASLVRRRAVAAAAIVAVFLVTTPIVAFSEGLDADSGTKELAALTNPPATLSYLGGWLYADHPVRYGPLLAVCTVALTLTCAALLVVRYRKVSA